MTQGQPENTTGPSSDTSENAVPIESRRPAPGAVRLPYAVFNDPVLSDGAKLTYMALRWLAPDYETCIASKERIRQLRGLCPRAIKYHLRQLERRGAIATEQHRGKNSRYILHAEKCSLRLRPVPGQGFAPVPGQKIAQDPGKDLPGSIKSVGTTVTFQESIPPQGGYGGAAAALAERFPQGTGPGFLPDLVARCQAIDPDVTDAELAALIRSAWQPAQRSPGLFLQTVPRLLEVHRRHRRQPDPVPPPRPTATCGACFAGLIGGEHDSTLSGVRGAVQHGARLCDCELGQMWAELVAAG